MSPDADPGPRPRAAGADDGHRLVVLLDEDGHPEPGEDLADAVHRRGWDELGARLAEVRSVLPEFRYRAVSASGIVENEVCPVYTARLASALDPHPEEVCDVRWMAFDDLRERARTEPNPYSPWMLDQLAQLADGALPGSG